MAKYSGAPGILDPETSIPLEFHPRLETADIRPRNPGRDPPSPQPGYRHFVLEGP